MSEQENERGRQEGTKEYKGREGWGGRGQRKASEESKRGGERASERARKGERDGGWKYK